MRLKQISARTLVNASQADVFNAVTDWEKQSNWIVATKVKGVGNNSHKLGGKLEAFTGIGRFGFLDTMTITKWDPPNVCEVTHTGSIVKGSGVFKIDVNDSCTYFTWTELTKVPFGAFGLAAWLVIAPFIKLSLKISLRRFRRIFS